MVAEKIDSFGFGIKLNGGAPLIALPFHFHGLVIGDPFADVVGLPSGARSKIHQMRPLSSPESGAKDTLTFSVLPLSSLFT